MESTGKQNQGQACPHEDKLQQQQGKLQQQQQGKSRLRATVKRLFDLLAVVAAAPLWLPLMAVVAVLVACKLGRPIFFTQERAGLGGRPFRMVKFRSMREGEGSDAERLTRFGRFLRASSLDELPELLLVVAGKMSLVGPRPLPTRYLPRYSVEQMRRHEALPGITGWAQVNGRNLLSWEEKFKHDVWYVDHQSLVLDLKILYLTFATVFKHEGISAANEATMSEFMGVKPGSGDSTSSCGRLG